MRYSEKNYLSDYEAKEAIIEIGRRMYNRNFVAANDGNITCRVGDNEIWTTPTGVSKGFMTADMLVKVDMEGKILAGSCKPSSELKMHLRVFQENPDLRGACHAHPPVATAFAIAGRGLNKAILTEAVLSIGEIPVAKYATPGTFDVPDSIAPFVTTHNGVLLANHGALSWGRDIFEAWYRLESIEFFANILMFSDNIIKEQNVLTCDQVNQLIDIRTRGGVLTGGVPICVECPARTSETKTETCNCSANESAEKACAAPPPKSTPSPEPTDMEKLIESVVRRVIEKL